MTPVTSSISTPHHDTRLDVCRVDVISSRRGSKARTIDSELRYALAALSGMMMAGERHVATGLLCMTLADRLCARWLYSVYVL